MVDFTNIRRIATAAAGALVISTACVAAAIGPGATAGQATGSYAAAQQVSVQAQQA
jgi:hypothetical protein